ncbi:MAG TPA: class I SAM-dependent methyltransferase [Paludibacteraceae bacterium]|nr:class I SAM-dependent methyltransferase [Paludibacteraceae bacterium]HOL29293.1 class I SAM-dependent methyltransferase [Paludibacteraceae bacterium]HON02483.1 class I SAM-dependent methyltransferase [Paludibacteraceae bacterium]HPD58960.1 class I SAM-dependent methyltransferase [Paludibacteraceae bacterium]HPQ12656.1 class I SAM-dependent methyltransferase [Paludibacteraceae bacterium]
MKKLWRIYRYFLHRFTARNTHGFGVHSPFLFHFICFVVEEKNPYYIFSSIENLRDRLLKDRTKIQIEDFGTGKSRTSTIATVVNKSVKSKKYGQLFFRITLHTKAQSVLELGTSLGITTAYLAAASSQLHCISLEGSQTLAALAKKNFQQLGLKNISLIEGNIDENLEKVLESTPSFDLIFIDANHTSQAVIEYFNMCLEKIHTHSVMLVDDIYWSADMLKAWKYIKQHPKVTATIDLFETGIVFFDPNLYKKHYKVRY